MANMFRVKESEVNGGHLLAERVLQLSLLLAVLAQASSAYLILREYQRLRAALDRLEPMYPPSVVSLREEVGIQLAVSLVASTNLALGLAALWWLRRREVSSQQSLRQVKMLAHDILASMDRGVVTINREAVITSINSAAIGLLEVDFECVGRPLASICPPDVPLAEMYREVVGQQAAVRDRDFNVERAGRVVRLRVDGHVLEDTQGTALGCAIHLRDVTERILMEERMRRMERFLSLTTLASGLHHEIKNPLTALSIHIQLLEESLSKGQAPLTLPSPPADGGEGRVRGEPVDELVGVLKTEVCRLNGVLESFRSFANLQHLTVQPTDALEVVENAIRLIRPQAAEQQVEITLLQPDKELPPVPLDAQKFEQAVLNLVINALEAMPEGGQLTLRVTLADREFCVSIQDSGPGIPPEIRPHVFQPYFSTKDRGSGMGLALSEKLVNQHGGHIGFRTGPEGTTFDIAIPLEGRNGSA
jgi:two-component system sensor histidine kinase HydH